MPGTKRLAVTGPWHGQIIEPTSDAYESISAQVPAPIRTALILPGTPEALPPAVEPEPVTYVKLTYPIPLVNGVRQMPLLVPGGIVPTGPEVLDALVLAAFGEVAS
jgi:hypothetical protein